ncbi:MAG: nitronate monooxygenase, partial [Actinomycetota bacterium]|nr:nitronate monooxygenase [Actinomycetota bacterium]
ASAVVVEGVEAGGHLGTDRPMLELLPEIIEAVSIPVIGAGGVVTGADIKTVLDMGAVGVQMGSRFAATVESSAPDDFKQMYVDAEADDIVLIQSPVGLPGRALRNTFSSRHVAGDNPKIGRCISCLKKCGKEFCIMDVLIRAQKGDVIHGLVFAGDSAVRVKDIPRVKDLVERLVSEWTIATEGVQA